MTTDETIPQESRPEQEGADAEGADAEGADAVTSRLRAAPAETGELRDRLAREAADAGLLEVAYRTVDSPIGGLLLAATDAGLAYVGFACEGEDAVLAMLARRLGPRVLRAPGRLDDAARQVEEYLGGRRTDFALPLDVTLATGFRGEVQRHLADIAYGDTATYKDIATALGRPGAVRAVGTACATNPLPLVWPCHRVLRTDGGLGGYRGGVDAKRRLLALEAGAAGAAG